MKVKQLLSNLPEKLRRDGEIILAHLLRVKPSELHLLEDEEVDSDTASRFFRLLERREGGEPTAYIIGEWDFFGRTLRVAEGVLIPRPETELLVEKVLPLIPEDVPWEGFEIGGGTGCVSITLLLERPLLRMSVSDVNPEAIRIMKENARLHRVEDRIEILKGSMFEPVRGRKFNFVISNPPYIPSGMWERLPEEVRREGRTSLIGGEKGWEFYERLSKEVRDYLLDGGFVALEIGHDQGDVVRRLLEGEGFKVKIYKDYSGQDRIVIGWS